LLVNNIVDYPSHAHRKQIQQNPLKSQLGRAVGSRTHADPTYELLREMRERGSTG
jgi:hypothetical protein